MNGITTTAAILLALAAYTLLANPAGTQPLQPAAPVGCTGDYVCGDDPSVVATWPPERWETVRRVRQQTVAGTQAHAPVSDVTKQ